MSTAALAAELAPGHDLASSVAGAKRYAHAAISNSYFVGRDRRVLGFVDLAWLTATGKRDIASLRMPFG